MATFMNSKLCTNPLQARYPPAPPTPSSFGVIATAVSGINTTCADVSWRTQEDFVPGIGPAAVAKLFSQKGVSSTVQLMGQFLLMGRSRAEFCKLLIEAGGMRQRRAARVRPLARCGKMMTGSQAARGLTTGRKNGLLRVLAVCRDLDMHETDEAMLEKSLQFCR